MSSARKRTRFKIYVRYKREKYNATGLQKDMGRTKADFGQFLSISLGHVKLSFVGCDKDKLPYTDTALIRDRWVLCSAYLASGEFK
jgi:hypothetical protein